MAGNSLGVKKTEAMRKHQSIIKKGKPIPWINDGKPRTEEHKINLSNSLKGRKSGKLGKTYEEYYGIDKAKKIKEILSQTHIGKYSLSAHPQAKCVMQYDLNGTYLAEFNCAAEAELALKIPQDSITYCCRGKGKSAYGYKWKFKNK